MVNCGCWLSKNKVPARLTLSHWIHDGDNGSKNESSMEARDDELLRYLLAHEVETHTRIIALDWNGLSWKRRHRLNSFAGRESGGARKLKGIKQS